MNLGQHKVIKESLRKNIRMLSENEISLCWCSIKEMGFCDTIYVLLKKNHYKNAKGLEN